MDIDKEELKNETKQTVNQVKDSLKDVDVGKEARETHGFIKGMCVEPFETVKSVATGEQEVFKRALILVIIHCAITFLISIFGYHFGNILEKLLDLVLDTLAPIITVLVPTIMILIMNKNNKKSATTIISTLVVARIPALISSAVSLIRTIIPKIALIASPISSTLSAIAIILTFYGMKTLFDEDKQAFLPKYAVIELVRYVVMYLV